MTSEAYSCDFPTRSIAFDDNALVSACQGGKLQAFALLVTKHQDRLFNSICRICGDEELAAEVCQDAFVRALENIADFRGTSRFYTWLYAISMNILRQQWRRGKLSGVMSIQDGPDILATQAAPLKDDPQLKASKAETHRRVMTAIMSLDFDHRSVIIMRDIEDFDYQQIATALAVPLGTIRSRLHRARKLLRSKLADLVEP